MKKKLNLSLILMTFSVVIISLSGCFLTPHPKLLPPTLSSPTDGATNVSTSVNLKWIEHASNSNITYKVYFGTSTTPSYYQQTDKTQMTISGLNYSTTYYWRVAAVNKAGKVATSDTWHFTTMAIPLPSTPTLSVTSVSTDSVSLQWTKSTNATSITLYSATSNRFSAVVTLYGSATSYTVTNLEPASVYEFFVVASNASGKATSNTVTATTQSIPTPPKPPLPSTPILSVTSVSTDSVSLAWSESKNASAIDVYSATSNEFSQIASLSSDATSYVANGLTPSTRYKFFVVATNPSGRATSNTVVATTQNLLPSTPTLSIESVSTNTIALKWTYSQNATAITIYRATSINFSSLVTLSGTATAYDVKGLKSSTTYKFFVVASNEYGCATSNTVIATTLKVVIKPIPPTVSLNSPNTYSVVLKWAESSTSVLGFHIWRRSNSNEAYTLISSLGADENSYTDIVNPGHTYSYMVSAYNSAGQSFSKSKSIFVGQNYFPMKTANSFAVVNVSPSVRSQKSKAFESKSYSLLNFIKTFKANGSTSSLIPVNEVITYKKSTSNGTTTYTVNVSYAFAGQSNVELHLSFLVENGKVYVQNFAPYPLLVLNSVYGDKPSFKSFITPRLNEKDEFSNLYSRNVTYISQMKFGNHVYDNVLKITLNGPVMTLVFYFVPYEGLMRFSVNSGVSTLFSYTTTSTFTTIPPVYPQTPVIVSPSANSTVPPTFTLKFVGDSSTYTVYLNSQTLISTSSTIVKIGPLSDGSYTLSVKAANTYGLETLSQAVNFTVQNEWTATPTYVVGDFTNWATNSNYKMSYDPVNKIYSLTTKIPNPPSTSVYNTNRYVIEQVYKGKILKYGHQPIPVTSGTVTFYFNQSLAKPFTSYGIGDTSKESRNWYFTSDVNGWTFSQMHAVGATFVATVATTGVFEPGTYGFKITPQATFSTTPASLTLYYFNGSYGAYYLKNGSFSIATPSNTIVIKFHVLNSKVDVEATNITSVYLMGTVSSWFFQEKAYKFKYDPISGIYSLTIDVPSTTGQQSYKVIYNNTWYGGPADVNIPVKSGTVTFYFDPSIATDPSKAVGIGDTSKESMTWYYRGDLNNWKATKMSYIGNGIFAATFAGNFSAGDYKFKIAPNNNWASSPYYYNGVIWNDTSSLSNGSLHLSTAASKVVVEFNVLKSLVTLHPVISPTYYVAGNFDSWQNVVGNSNYKMSPNSSGIYTLNMTLPSTTGQYQYKIVEWTGTQTVWYGGPASNANYGNIPVKAGNVTFYFNPSIASGSPSGGNSDVGIGDTTKETMKWYFASDINNWKFATMTYIGNAVFAATITRSPTNDSAGVYRFKITPQAKWSTQPASLTQYYFNGGYGGYYSSNGTVTVPQATIVVVYFNVLDSSVSAKAAKIQTLHQVIMAYLDKMNEIHASLNSKIDTSDLSQFKFSVNGHNVPISSVVDANTGLSGISDYITVNLSTPLKPSDVASPMVLKIDGFATSTVYARYALNNSAFHYDGQLGAIYTPYQTTFKVWSPVCDKVVLLLFKNANDTIPYATYTMTKNVQGVWSTSVMGDLNGVYYEYSYHRYGEWVTAPDVYSKAANAENTKSMVVDLTQTDPSDWNDDVAPFPDNMVDAIVYELHVQDFTDNPNSGVLPQYQGTYMGFTQTGTTYDGVPTGLDHLAQLGINYVQLMPIEDYEDPQNPGYNWGYVPYLYMVPEPKYSTTPDDPANTIDEVKQMIEALHSKGIGVILDISFSHTSYVTTPYSAAVPYYYYNYDEYGQKTNYSGVGNDLATENYMVEKLILDTLKYWMNEYHVSGFRFDQMYLYDPKTIQDIVQVLTTLYPGVLLYGEPWNALGYKFTYGDQRGMQLGVFNGYFRDAIIGTANDPTKTGFVNGNAWNSDVQNEMKSGIVGSVPYGDLPDTFADEPNETINYSTCHDNYTLWDKITMAQPTWSASEDIAAQKLAGAIVMLSQGVAFMQGGAEFARTKDGNGNSYNVQTPNEFDWSRLTRFASIDDYYQGLIAIRKAHLAFRMTSFQDIDDNLTFLSGLPDGVIGYEINGESVDDSWSDIVVYFNGNTTIKTVTLPAGTWNIAVNGAVASTSSIGKVSGTIQLSALSAYVLFK